MHLFVKEGYHDIIYIGTKLNGSRAKAYAGCFRYCNKYQIRHFDFIFDYKKKGLKCIDIGEFGADLSKRIADICDKELQATKLIVDYIESNKSSKMIFDKNTIRKNDQLLIYSVNDYFGEKIYVTIIDNERQFYFDLICSKQERRLDKRDFDDVNKRNFGSILILDDSIYSEIKELITPQFFNDRDFLNELVLRLACFAKDDYNGLSRFRL